MAALKKGLALVLTIAMVAVTAIGGCLEGNKPADNKPPVARISSPSTGSVFDTGILVTFNGTESYDPEKKDISFNWSFGDNATGTGNVTSHVYASPGKYPVSLVVSDGKKKGTDRIELNIKQANRAPAVVLAASNLTASNEELVEFNATATTDADNDALTFSWDFGDGGAAQGPIVTHRYTGVAQFNVSCNVSDGKAWSVGRLAMTVYQANRPPVPVLRATPLVAFKMDGIEFNASGSTDPDNDTLTASWDFGDGASGAGLVATHGYSAIGNFMATASVSDGRLSRVGNVIVTIIPRATILLDWNGTDYGYIVKLDADAGLANLTARVEDTAGGSDITPNITAAGARDFRIRTMVAPVKGEVLTVTVYFDRYVMATRKMTIYENTPMPGQNCTVGMNASTSNHKTYKTANESRDEWFNLSGTIDVMVSDGTGEYSYRISGGSIDSTSSDSLKNTTRGKADITGWFNMTMVWGAQGNKSMELVSEGNSSQTNATGVFQSSMHSRSVQKVLDHNGTFVSLSGTGKYGDFDTVQTVELLGIENKANGNGAIFSCFKLRTNRTADGYSETPGGSIHIKQFYEAISWVVRDDRYVNTTICQNTTMNTYSVNDTSGAWTQMPEYSQPWKEEFVDSNNDHKFNPDPAPMTMDEMFEFHTPCPRELLPGDRIVATNVHGVKMVLEVSAAGAGQGQTISGVHLEPVVVNITYSNEQGNVTGTTAMQVAAGGNMTGLPISSQEKRTWVHGDETETSTSKFLLVAIRED